MHKSSNVARLCCEVTRARTEARTRSKVAENRPCEARACKNECQDSPSASMVPSLAAYCSHRRRREDIHYVELVRSAQECRGTARFQSLSRQSCRDGAAQGAAPWRGAELFLQTANCIKIIMMSEFFDSLAEKLPLVTAMVRNAVTRHTCSTAERRKRPDPAPPSASLLRLHPGVQKCLQSRRKTRYTSPPGKVAPSIPSPPPLLPLNSCIHCSQRVQHGAAAPPLPVQCPLVLRPPGDLSIAWSRSGSRR